MSPTVYYDIKRKINFLRKNAASQRHIDILTNLIREIQNGVCRPALTLENNDIYRARPNDPGRLFDCLNELIYPPAAAAKKNRFNRPNCSIFYGALCELGTIIELQPAIHKFFTISKFNVLPEKVPLYFPIAIKGQDGVTDRFATPINRQSDKLVLDFFDEEITKRCTDEE